MREGDEYKLKDGNYTVKKDGNGNVEIENGQRQVKIDKNTGERKVKKDRNITDKVKKYCTNKKVRQPTDFFLTDPDHFRRPWFGFFFFWGLF